MLQRAYNNLYRIFGLMIVSFLMMSLFPVTQAHAQSLLIATGGSAGTYHAMFQELNQRCSVGDLQIKEVASSGSNENVDKMVANQVSGAIVQTDVLFFRSKTEDLTKIGTLFTLHQEQIHLIARSEGVTVGGFYGIGGTTIHFNTILDLKGRNVGAAGGSVLTAKVINAQSSIGFNVVEFPSNSVALEALQKGQVDAVTIVGGAPMKDVSALPAAYRLLPIPPQIQDKLKAVYQPTRLSYRNLAAAGIPTVEVQSILVAREYHSQKLVAALKQYRQCFLSNVDDLQDAVGLAPAWQNVSKTDKGHWPYLNLN